MLLPQLEHAAAGPVPEQQLGRHHQAVLDTEPSLPTNLHGALLLRLPCSLVGHAVLVLT